MFRLNFTGYKILGIQYIPSKNFKKWAHSSTSDNAHPGLIFNLCYMLWLDVVAIWIEIPIQS